MSEDEHREIIHLCAQTGLQLMQYGAESTLAETVAQRVGRAFGVPCEVAITANALTVSSHQPGGRGLTVVKRIFDRGINMSVTTDVQQIMLEAEAGRLSRPAFAAALEAITPFHYPRWLLVLLIGVSCAAFARLAHADGVGCAIVFVAASLAMIVRLVMVRYHFRPLVSFFVAAFVATVVAALGVKWELSATPKPTLAAPVLLLVPGFPLINAVSDMVKGHINVGISRATMAFLLCASTCGGVILAMTLLNVWGWL